MSFNTVKKHCNKLSGVKDKGMNCDLLYTFNLIEPGYMIIFAPIKTVYIKIKQNKERSILKIMLKMNMVE